LEPDCDPVVLGVLEAAEGFESEETQAAKSRGRTKRDA